MKAFSAADAVTTRANRPFSAVTSGATSRGMSGRSTGAQVLGRALLDVLAEAFHRPQAAHDGQPAHHRQHQRLDQHGRRRRRQHLLGDAPALVERLRDARLALACGAARRGGQQIQLCSATRTGWPS